MAFRIGQRVVCVRPGWPKPGNRKVRRYPTHGQVYTVRGFSDAPYPGEAIYLEEIVNPTVYWPGCDWTGEAAFMTRRFRPLIERKTSTGFEILDEIRRTTRAPVRATV